MGLQPRLRWCRERRGTRGKERIEKTMTEIMSQKVKSTMETLCRRCGFHPVSPRIAGYCSWDCYDADDEQDEAEEDDDEKAA